MERLTHQRSNGIKTGYWTSSKKDELVARLGEYEDTDLEPREIMELKGLYQERCAELNLLRELKEQQVPETKEEKGESKKKKQDETSGVPGPYRGFMHIKCPQCGAIKNFCAKKETEIFYCDACKAKVHLEDMARVLLKCECGKVAAYYTNRYDHVFDIECVQCEMPVTVEWNRKAKKYTTISNGGY